MVILRGNHDPQWYWPEVQLAFAGWLKNAYTDLIRAIHDPSTQELPVHVDQLKNWLPAMSLEDYRRKIDFDHSWYYYRDRLAYVEHGGQQEAVDLHRYFLIPTYAHPDEADGSDSNYLQPWEVDDIAVENVLDFLNRATTPEEIADAVEIPDERDVGLDTARRILKARPTYGFSSLNEVADVPQVGRERFTEIVRSLGQILSRRLDPDEARWWLSSLEVSSKETEIEPPIGSLGNIFFINNVEIQFPNIDRPGYETHYLGYLRYGNPKLAWYFLVAFWRMVKAMTKWAMLPIANWWQWMRGRAGGLRARYKDFLEWRARKHEERLTDYARLTGLPRECAEELDRTKWVKRWRWPASSQLFVLLEAVLFLVPLFVLVVALYNSFQDNLGFNIPIFDTLLRWTDLPKSLLIKIGIDLSDPPFWYRIVTPFLLGFLAYWGVHLLRNFIGLGEDFLYKPAKRVAGILQKYDRSVPYLLFGHDHVRNAQQLKTGPWYLNTGAWMHKFGKDRKRLLREPLEYSFVRMLDTHRVLASKPDDYMIPRADARPIVDLLRWNDEGGWVEECETFEGLEEVNIPDELDLVRMYEPVLRFSKDGKGEQEAFFPVAAEYYVRKCGLRRRRAGWVHEPGKVQVSHLAHIDDPKDCYLVFSAQDDQDLFSLLDQGLELRNVRADGGIDILSDDGSNGIAPRLLLTEPELEGLQTKSPRLLSTNGGALVVTSTNGARRVPEHDGSDDLVSVIAAGISDLPDEMRKTALENYAPRSYENWKNHAPVYHYHISRDGPYTVFQYWFFYAYNDWAWHGGMNDHEGDWEVVYVFLDDRMRPRWVVSSRHNKIPLLYEPESVYWPEVERVDETHPVVYVGCGSHASYLDRGTHSIVGVNDYAKGNDRSIGVGDGQAWGDPVRLTNKGWNSFFSGNWGALVRRWGEVVMPGTSGPMGPAHQGDKWYHPGKWAGLT
jgi:hypothetical protein